MPHGRHRRRKGARYATALRKSLAINGLSADRFEIKSFSPVPKKTKTDSTNSTAPSMTASAPAPAETLTKVKPDKRTVALKTAARKGAAKKKTKPTPPRKTAVRKRTATPPVNNAAEPSDADIQLRAYFIAERRMQLSLPGDSAEDWLEAKRQLSDEAAQKAT